MTSRPARVSRMMTRLHEVPRSPKDERRLLQAAWLGRRASIGWQLGDPSPASALPGSPGFDTSVGRKLEACSSSFHAGLDAMPCIYAGQSREYCAAQTAQNEDDRWWKAMSGGAEVVFLTSFPVVPQIFGRSVDDSQPGSGAILRGV